MNINIKNDLLSRFIINLPPDEWINNSDRLCYHCEQSYWYYLDNYCNNNNQNSNNENNHSNFIKYMQELLKPFFIDNDNNIIKTWVQHYFNHYKPAIPVVGIVLLDLNKKQILMVQPRSTPTKWTIPKGKQNKNESEIECMMREFTEETGFIFQQTEKNCKKLGVFKTKYVYRTTVYVVLVSADQYCPRDSQNNKEIEKVEWQNMLEKRNLTQLAQQVIKRVIKKYYSDDDDVGDVKGVNGEQGGAGGIIGDVINSIEEEDEDGGGGEVTVTTTCGADKKNELRQKTNNVAPIINK